ncbi:MAG: hypothetical protein LQ338_007918 [Usnochroma carphineum]|nr:MAG: hypothetical protein LQ338_007918 [Usnochroma carphineum]
MQRRYALRPMQAKGSAGLHQTPIKPIHQSEPCRNSLDPSPVRRRLYPSDHLAAFAFTLSSFHALSTSPYGSRTYPTRPAAAAALESPCEYIQQRRRTLKLPKRQPSLEIA